MFSLSEILWSSTEEVSFEKAYVRFRRTFSIRERDWRRHPLHFDFEVLNHPQFLEHQKQAKQLCWHWLQLELNCTHRASTLQELPNIPEKARVLWLNDQVVDDPRIIYYLGRDKYDPQCIEEIVISGLATPLYRFRQQNWILLPPWVQVLDNNGYLVFFDLSHPKEVLMLQSLWKGKILAERFVCLESHPTLFLKEIPSLQKVQRLPITTTPHHHHNHHHHEKQEIPQKIKDIQELLRLLCTHPPEKIAPEFHVTMTGFVMSFVIGHLYEEPLMEFVSEEMEKKSNVHKESLSIRTSQVAFYDLILLSCSALAANREVWIDIDNSTPLSTKNTAALLAQHASGLHLPLYLGQAHQAMKITSQHIPTYLQCAIWTGGDILPLLQDAMFLDGTSRLRIHSVFVPLEQLEDFLENLDKNMERAINVNPIRGIEDILLFRYVTKGGHSIKIKNLSIGINDIVKFTPIHVTGALTIYTFASIEEIITKLLPWQFALETLLVEPKYLFTNFSMEDQEKEKEMPHMQHLPQLQKLFSQVALMGLLHQRSVKEQFPWLS
jgi:hypothetical protein